MNMPDAACEFSVVIVTYNRPQRLREVLRHTTEVFRGLSAEILVVNNGRDQVVLPGLGDQPDCRVMQMPGNLGTAARNHGWRAARGECVFFIDDDAYMDRGIPAAVREILRRQADVGAVSLPIHDGRRAESCLLPTVFHGCACAIRRKALEKIGGYPTAFTYYGEEYHVTFQLYAAGYRIAHCTDGGRVYHAREPSGRDINRIIRLLVRNNVHLWCAFFPLWALTGAIRDTLQRYHLVARKENAGRGFRAGCLELPRAVGRGMRARAVLPPAVFDRVTLCDSLRAACERLRHDRRRRLIICGTGKFPSLWRRIINSHGLKIAGYLETNRCWQNVRLGGAPIITAIDDEFHDIPPHDALLAGLDAPAANANWLDLFQRRPPDAPVIHLPTPG